MRLLTVLFLLFQGVQVKVLGQVSGYEGENITLPSNADQSWVLSKIDWSIFPNNTWIATYDNGQTNVERRPEYKGRLTLDVKSGNLTIQNLRKSDEMEYTVDLLNENNENKVNKIKLTVNKPLQKPTIMKIQSIASNASCVLILNCSSPDVDVELIWKVEDSYRHYNSSPQSGTSELVAFFQTVPVSVKATCTAMRRMENASEILTLQIKGPDEPPPPPCRCRSTLFFFTGFIVGISCLGLLYVFRDMFRKHCSCE